MDIVLIAGLWLDGSVWDSVTVQLEARGHRGVPVTLPGQGDGNTSATLADQSAAVVAAVDAAACRPMVVGHSAACSLAWLAADARPGKISKIVLIGGFPAQSGEQYFDGLPVRDGVLPFPGWSEFEGPDSADLDDAAKQAIASTAIPVPEGVAGGVIRLADERRYDVPVVLICPEFTPAQAREWIGLGEVPERRAHACLVIDEDGSAQGWCQYGSPGELPSIKHKREYDKGAQPLPDWRITCFFVDKKHRGQGIARAALEGALDQIASRGGGLVEAISEVTAGREAQGRFLFSATVELFEQNGFTRVRQVGKHAWIVSKMIQPA